VRCNSSHSWELGKRGAKPLPAASESTSQAFQSQHPRDAASSTRHTSEVKRERPLYPAKSSRTPAPSPKPAQMCARKGFTMLSISDLTVVDQARGRKSKAGSKRKGHALNAVVQFATSSKAPTLQQAQDAAAGCLARLLVSYFREHDQGVRRG